ncbi:tRNA (adenosine(37)-N6)-threonylcarbamoyltransferase complex ATPase subunit type 1 TsaE [bacterium]|jgi:tRNA threonylcarbamoyladenosine biosynthesis protein TsaE|nr:tRNA (adenosine(37)-N6)-threonylcarbamoyltransferase complex ATPase subunit type 1 TsaE [bacterium]MBT3903702.1 tRNA (adenosine(37)-N6)-threonylcarbamoyltransferase complex ATPase subunit type 1 TsaE [bacterium]MBT4577461.1 tRNA (adenosine(37)-N6)-threonylcarbamoyltransferase complex ATPase subunit type 1 TsaE [bacterium]MBT5345831.1 tRNA (adenosine(37)-N6)-threonylcarbamoyltransferase complex ATPase subunit type 1 TsaE [bacterium]MBT6131281.1 tRNA (adenosine(37)-N6)-threonylcarbamoyltransfe
MTMPLQLKYSLKEVARAVELLKNQCKPGAILTFEGELGAGKTTLIKHLLKACGVKEVVSSPTFAYVNSYRVDGLLFHHFDLYRIDSVERFVELGFDQMLEEPGSICLIEWPGVIQSILVGRVCKVSIEYDGLESRVMNVSCSSEIPNA